MKLTRVPEHAIESIVGKMHVGDSDEKVLAEIRRRVPKDWTDTVKKACDKYALKVHKRNRHFYNVVMNGGI